jgi:choline dehydrogenase
VLFEGNRATGVEYIQNKQTVQAGATREVLLSGGAVNTPQVLMLSGIGDAEILRRFDIPVVLDLKGVGKNLQDHLDCSIQYESSQPITLYSQSNPIRQLKTGLQYMLFGTGVATGQGLESGGFVKSRPDLDTPDLQFHFITALMYDHTRKKADRHGFMAHVCQLRPESRGYISIKSADPFAAPVIQPNYLEAPRPSTLIAAPSSCRERMSGRTTRSMPSSARRRRRSITPSAAPKWDAIKTPWSIRSSRCMASKGCASSTPP